MSDVREDLLVLLHAQETRDCAHQGAALRVPPLPEELHPIWGSLPAHPQSSQPRRAARQRGGGARRRGLIGGGRGGLISGGMKGGDGCGEVGADVACWPNGAGNGRGELAWWGQ